MAAHEHRRPPGRRLTPMPEPIRKAAGIYLDEQIELLTAAGEVLDGRGDGAARERLRKVDALKRHMVRLRTRLDPPTRPGGREPRR